MQYDDEALVNQLVQNGKVSQETLDQLITEQEKALENAQNSVSGRVYAIAPDKQILFVEDLLSGEILAEFPLPQNHPEGTPYQTLALATQDTGTSAGSLSYEADAPYGLVKAQDFTCFYQGDPLDQSQLGLTSVCLSPLSKDSEGPIFDLYMGRNHLCLVDRQAGEVSILDLESLEMSSPIQLRPRGSLLALNLTFCPQKDLVYISDNQLHLLSVLDLNARQLDKIDLGLHGYVLGNIALSPDGKNMYILTLKPNVELLYYQLANQELLKKFSLKGEPYSICEKDRVDLLNISPDHKYLLLMTCLTEQSPSFPVISVIDMEKVKTVRRYSIKEHAKPFALSFGHPNPVLAHQKTPLELLLQAGKITQDDLQVTPVLDPENPLDPEEGQGAVPSLAPQKSNTIALPEEQAKRAILGILSEKLYQLAEVELQNHPDELERFQEEAEHIRKHLETHDSAEVDLPEILGKHTLESLISRQEVLTAIETQELEAKDVVQPPSQCPHCSADLDGSWDCPSCGLELESPERKFARENASLSPIAHLPNFQLLLADSRQERLLILDRNRTMEWVLDQEALPYPTPWSALALPNKNLLVVDQMANTVYECGPSGSKKWAYQAPHPDEDLSQPVKATFIVKDGKSLYLIVDQGNHRVLAVDRNSEIQWQYGVKGEAEMSDTHLYMPSDIQWTHQNTCLIADTGNDRVIEINLKDNSVVQIFGEDWGLCAPTFAERLYNGHTLIVDSGNYRVVELDDQGDIAYECFYFKEEMGDAMRIDYPIHAIRGHRKNLLLMDEDKVIELIPAQRRLIWSSLLEHLAKRVEIKDNEENQETYSKSFFQYKMPTMDDILLRLRKQGQKDSGLAARLMENFNRLLEVKRELDKRRAERAKAQIVTDCDFSQSPIFAVDRTFQQVLQINRKGKVEWHFGTHPNFKLLRPTHVCQSGESVLIADTSNRRILGVNQISGTVEFALGGKQERLFNQPRSVQPTLGGHLLVADQGNKRLVEVNRQGKVLWEFKNLTKISSPYFATELGTGTILFADWALQMVKEIRRDGTVIWAYGQSRRVGSGPNQLSCPEYAIRLPEGSTLIADTRNNRVIEVAPNRNILWEYLGDGSFNFEAPNYCQRLPDGHTLIAYDNYRQMLEVDSEGTVYWHFELGSAPMVRASAG